MKLDFSSRQEMNSFRSVVGMLLCLTPDKKDETVLWTNPTIPMINAKESHQP